MGSSGKLYTVIDYKKCFKTAIKYIVIYSKINYMLNEIKKKRKDDLNGKQHSLCAEIFTGY